MSLSVDADRADAGAREIRRAFHALHADFRRLTRVAAQRFAGRDWPGQLQDAQRRLELHPGAVDRLVRDLAPLLGADLEDRATWKRIKRAYAWRIDDEPNAELAGTFFNSATRRIFSTVGVDPEIEFLDGSAPPDARPIDPAICVRHPRPRDACALIRSILTRYDLGAPYRDLERDAARGGQRLARELAVAGDSATDDAETLGAIFYRNKGAYVVGRLRCGGRLVPLVLPLVHGPDRVELDAVLTDEDEISILFSFARSPFHVETARPRELIVFLKSILPAKPVAELYISLGYAKHGKTELFRSLQEHLEQSDDRFETTPGDRGMVMIVFGLPSFDVVFKVIRDRFPHQKRITRRLVRERYRLVSRHDRVGRLVDTQEFEHLRFRRSRFAPELLQELQREAGRSVQLDARTVTFRHLYTERRVVPLNLHLRRAGVSEARRAMRDYGRAIKELAGAGIFPGDFLIKNFGVTRHGRVVFYDYDELCMLRECRFRSLPAPRTPEDEMAAEPWFTVGEHDIFPEEFRTFLELAPELREEFAREHGDLFRVAFWSGLQRRVARGELDDLFPYPARRRLRGMGRRPSEKSDGQV